MKEKIAFKGKFLELIIKDNRWEIIKHADAITILAMKDGKMLLVKQYRHGPNANTWEAPAGLIEIDEKPIDAADRELIEECGMSAEFQFLTSFYVSPGFCDELVHLFLAKNLKENIEGKLEGEIDEVMWLEPRILLEKIANREIISSSSTVSAALYGILLDTEEKSSPVSEEFAI